MSRQKSRNNAPANTHNQLRIIGGQWRGRKLSFPDSEGLRPTPDRVRETLFNWLAPEIAGARCLDLFSGSGALGIEALSRGASWVDMNDSVRAVAQQLRSNLSLLSANTAQVKHSDALNWLQQEPHEPYDIVFLDPPFRKGLADECIEAIVNNGILKPHAWVYLEMANDEVLPAIPDTWQLHRDKTAGQVRYQLYCVES
jgi:16S rRNA (guanine966-N2)-methyltransferase